MNNAFSGHFGLEFMVRYSEILRRVQKRSKGLKITHLWAVAILGASENGMRVCEVNSLEPALHRSTIQQKLRRARNGGFVVQTGRLYSLSDAGRAAYAILVEESQTEMNRLVSAIALQSKKRIKRA